MRFFKTCWARPNKVMKATKVGRSFLTSLVVLPVILICLGALKRLVNRVFSSLHWVWRKLVAALLTNRASLTDKTLRPCP